MSGAAHACRVATHLVRRLQALRHRLGARLARSLGLRRSHARPRLAPLEDRKALAQLLVLHLEGNQLLLHLLEQARDAPRAHRHLRSGILQVGHLGDRLELHPAQKQAVGARLAKAAEALDRGETATASGPQIVAARVEGTGILLSFRGIKGRFQSLSGVPIGFELCGPDQSSCRFAQATIDGTVIRLTGDGRPLTRVRYAWADAPVVNLYDESGLPVSSFEVPVTNDR